MQELKVIADFYDFALWLTRHIEKFPRHHRYSLGLHMEQQLYLILRSLLRAKYTKDRTATLSEVNLDLETLRFLVRMAKDLAILPVKSHSHAAQVLLEIGAQVGGWARSSRA